MLAAALKANRYLISIALLWFNEFKCMINISINVSLSRLECVCYLPEAGVGLGIGLCCVPSADGCPGIYIHTLSPGSVAHMDGRLR